MLNNWGWNCFFLGYLRVPSSLQRLEMFYISECQLQQGTSCLGLQATSQRCYIIAADTKDIICEWEQNKVCDMRCLYNVGHNSPTVEGQQTRQDLDVWQQQIATHNAVTEVYRSSLWVGTNSCCQYMSLWCYCWDTTWWCTNSHRGYFKVRQNQGNRQRSGPEQARDQNWAGHNVG